MNYNGELITIKEAAEITGINTTTLYKKIKKGKLTCTCHQVQGVEIKKVKKADIARLYKILQVPSSASQVPADAVKCQQVPSGARQMPSSAERKTEIREVIEEFFEQKQTQIMQPMQDQALYIAGALTKENEFLRQKIETIRLENSDLQEKIKMLPDKSEVDQLHRLQEELKEENVKLQQEQEQSKSEIQKLEEKLKEADDRISKSEQDKIEMAEAWKKELDEARRPWWKKLFG